MNVDNRIITVTGGLGFIGSHFVDMLLREREDWIVRVLDAKTYCASENNLRGYTFDERLTLLHGSICDGDILERVLDGCYAVVHFAAESHVDRSIECFDTFFETNTLGTVNVLRKCMDSPVKRIIVISSDEVYGSCHSPAVEDVTPFRPRSPYAASKAAADLAASSFHATYGLPVCIARPVNNFGPRQYPEKLVAKFISGVLEGRRTPVYGTGENTREWLYVGDTCRALLRLLESEMFEKHVSGEAFNIGSGVELSALAMLETIAGMMNVDVREFVEYVGDRPGHVVRHCVDWTKIQRLIGWQPGVGIDRGLAMTIDWYRNMAPGGWRRWWCRDGDPMVESEVGKRNEIKENI